MANLPPEYYRGVEQMEAAAAAWAKAHPFAEPRFSLKPFEDEMKRRAGLPPEAKAMIGATLAEVIDKIGVNEDARALMREMVRATGGKATYFQFKCIYELKVEAHVKRGQGHMADGDWRCPCCSQMLDGFTRLDGVSEAPAAGAITICAYCGALSKVNDESNAFVSVGADELQAYPADVKRQIHDLRNTLHKAQAEKERRS
jgi:hypothetical protein